MLVRELESLRLLVVDRYTAPEVIDRLGLSTDEVLDNYLEEVYTNLERFDEIIQDYTEELLGDEENIEDYLSNET